jgi:hypothetical protein
MLKNTTSSSFDPAGEARDRRDGRHTGTHVPQEAGEPRRGWPCGARSREPRTRYSGGAPARGGGGVGHVAKERWGARCARGAAAMAVRGHGRELGFMIHLFFI